MAGGIHTMRGSSPSRTSSRGLVRPGGRPPQSAGFFAICRTCRNCRQKKVKCDGRQPRCGACSSRGIECLYPQDARRTAGRTRKADVRALQRQIEDLRREIHGAGTPPTATSPIEADNQDVHGSTVPRELLEEHSPDLLPAMSDGKALRSFRASPSDNTLCTPQRDEQLESEHVALSADGAQLGNPTEVVSHENASSPEPKMPEGGSRVYGATSLLHDRLSETPLANRRSSHRDKPTATTENTKAQLISNAALRRQEELTLKYSPSVAETIDFDGVPMDLAMHLLELHWNRQHLSYLLTYRPAIMDSLITNGPYVNKLLLNAIYMQSSLYSDRTPLPLNRQEQSSKGLVYYKRFKELLHQYIDTPTIPTVVALLTCGACLVPYGQQSAGWALSGMAYQMVIDLGCHLEFSPPDEGHQAFTSSLIEQEMKKRIYWGAYVSDKFQSLFLGRPPAMNEATGNVTCDYLDSFEEMEVWTPYYDPAFPIFGTMVPVYHGRPSHATSTFKPLLQLCKIAARIIDAFYSVNSAASSDKSLLQTRQNILLRLKQWDRDLSPWLRFDPNTDVTPPPHQMTLHTTYWTLVILVEQAFLNRGHFRFTLDPPVEDESRQNCIQAALQIWKLVDAYRKAFTLRRAQYGISYATYCAVLVMLQHTRQENDEYHECIQFFWSTLWEYQRGCNYGLERPLRLLRSLMWRLQRTAKESDTGDGDRAVPNWPAPASKKPKKPSMAQLTVAYFPCLKSLTMLPDRKKKTSGIFHGSTLLLMMA